MVDNEIVSVNAELDDLIREMGIVADRLRSLRSHESTLRERLQTLEQTVRPDHATSHAALTDGAPLCRSASSSTSTLTARSRR